MLQTHHFGTKYTLLVYKFHFCSISYDFGQLTCNSSFWHFYLPLVYIFIIFYTIYTNYSLYTSYTFFYKKKIFKHHDVWKSFLTSIFDGQKTWKKNTFFLKFYSCLCMISKNHAYEKKFKLVKILYFFTFYGHFSMIFRFSWFSSKKNPTCENTLFFHILYTSLYDFHKSSFSYKKKINMWK